MTTTINKHLPLAIAISLACGQSAQADTFNFRFGLEGAATALGSFTTTDSTTGSLAGAFNTSGLANVTALNLTVSGASAGNGTFTLADFNNMYFNSGSALDFTRDLVGQAGFDDFNVFGSAPTPSGSSNFTLRSNGGGGSSMVLSCFALSSVLSACSSQQGQLQTYAGRLGFAAASTLDGLRGGANAEMTALIATLDALSPAAQSAALAKIAPQSNQANESAANDFNRSVLSNIGSRLHRAQGERALVLGLAQQPFDSSLMLADNSANAGAGLGQLAGSGQYGLWLQAFGGKSRQDLHANYSGFEANTSGLTIGADTRLSNEWIVGGAFSYGRTDVSQQDYRNGDSSDIDTYQLTAYASRDFGLWYLDGVLGYAQQNYETKRNTAVAGVAKGDFDGSQLLAKVEAGYPIALGRQLTLTPLAALEWNRLALDSYTEKGAGALSLRVNGEHTQRTASHLGARLEMAIDMNHGATLYPSAHARWVHQFDNDGTDTTAAFIGGGSSFVTPGQNLAANSYIVGVGLTYQQANGSAIGLQLDTDQATARSGYAGTVTAQWLF